MTIRKKTRFDIRESGPKIAIGLGIALAANVIFAIAVVRPKQEEIRRIEEEGAPEIQRVREREKTVERLEGYHQALRQGLEDIRRLREDVLSTRSRRLIEVQLELFGIAKRMSVSIDKIQNENTPLPDEGLERFAMIVPLEGGYRNLRQFIQAVEASEKFLVVERVTLGSANDGGALLQMNITVATYFDRPDLREPPPSRARRT